MTARLRRGRTEASRADEYFEGPKRTGLREYWDTNGDRGVYVLRRIREDRAESLLISF